MDTLIAVLHDLAFFGIGVAVIVVCSYGLIWYISTLEDVIVYFVHRKRRK